MAAKLETFFELKKVVDHDCGNYQIGEIDFINYAKIREYVDRHGQFGYDQLMWVLPRIMTEAQSALMNVRMRESMQAEAARADTRKD